jgi:hypothetical protein
MRWAEHVTRMVGTSNAYAYNILVGNVNGGNHFNAAGSDDPSNWRTTPCRLSATAYSIYSQVSSIRNLRTRHAAEIRGWYGLD